MERDGCGRWGDRLPRRCRLIDAAMRGRARRLTSCTPSAVPRSLRRTADGAGNRIRMWRLRSRAERHSLFAVPAAAKPACTAARSS